MTSDQTIRLSICIPTHHGRQPFLEELCGVLLEECKDLGEPVRVCVSDNASTDGTEAMMQAYIAQYPGMFAYHRNPENMGFTANLLGAIEMAESEYCWIVSSDDGLEPGALRKVLEFLAGHPGITGASLEFAPYDFDLTTPRPPLPRALLPDAPDEDHLYTDFQDFMRECGSVMGYISGQVIRRERWMDAAKELREDLKRYPYFPHMFLIGRMVTDHPAWGWISGPIVKHRADNDSFSEALGKDWLKYHRNTTDDTARIWAHYLGTKHPTYQRHMRAAFAVTCSGASIMYCKAYSPMKIADEAAALATFTRLFGFLPAYWVTAFPCLLIPHPVFRAAAGVRNALRGRSTPPKPAGAAIRNRSERSESA